MMSPSDDFLETELQEFDADNGQVCKKEQSSSTAKTTKYIFFFCCFVFLFLFLLCYDFYFFDFFATVIKMKFSSIGLKEIN